MKLLVDTQLLIWSGLSPDMLSETARAYLRDAENELVFSTVTIWEIAIKSALQKPDFGISSRAFLAGLRRSGYRELAISSEHACAVERLPAIHKDPFDRLLAAQSAVENIALLTADMTLARYPGSIIKV